MTERDQPPVEPQATQPKYLLNMGGRPALHVQAENLNTLRYIEQTHVADSGFGVPTGRVDIAHLHVMARNYGRTFPATAQGVRQVIRELRPQEAAELTAVDQRIDDLLAQVKRLREERTQLVKQAWEKGHVVPLKVLRSVADQKLAGKGPAT